MSKAAKFTMVDPVGDNGLIQAMMHQEVNDRMGRAVEDLAEKYAGHAHAEEDESVTGPTGAAYQAQRAAKSQAQKEARAAKKKEQATERAAAVERVGEIRAWEAQQAGEDSDSDDEALLRELEDDHELEKLREARLQEMRRARNQHQENLAKGHGQYREIVQDEFLTEVTGSLRVLCHFYHQDFQQCKVMDMHLERICGRHTETKFLKINAEKAPFFVKKLAVRTLPTVVYFIDGVATQRQTGFDGIQGQTGEGYEETFPTENLEARLGRLGAIDYIAPPTTEEYRDLYGKSVQSNIQEGLQELDAEYEGYTGTIDEA